MPAKHCRCPSCRRASIERRIHHVWQNMDDSNEANGHREVAALALELADVVDEQNGYDTRN